jgi:hypothetical protein
MNLVQEQRNFLDFIYYNPVRIAGRDSIPKGIRTGKKSSVSGIIKKVNVDIPGENSFKPAGFANASWPE